MIRIEGGKSLVSAQNCKQRRTKKDINKEVGKTIKVSTCAVRNNVLKVKNKYLIFKTSIVGMKTHLLVDNKSKVELIDESFMHANKISIFELEKPIDLILKNSKVVQQLTK